jgi:hypothetical protein
MELGQNDIRGGGVRQVSPVKDPVGSGKPPGEMLATIRKRGEAVRVSAAGSEELNSELGSPQVLQPTQRGVKRRFSSSHQAFPKPTSSRCSSQDRIGRRKPQRPQSNFLTRVAGGHRCDSDGRILRMSAMSAGLPSWIDAASRPPPWLAQITPSSPCNEAARFRKLNIPRTASRRAGISAPIRPGFIRSSPPRRR